MGDDERGRDNDWFDNVNTKVCFFKRKVHCWLREGVQRAKSSKYLSKSNRSVPENETWTRITLKIHMSQDVQGDLERQDFPSHQRAGRLKER